MKKILTALATIGIMGSSCTGLVQFIKTNDSYNTLTCGHSAHANALSSVQYTDHGTEYVNATINGAYLVNRRVKYYLYDRIGSNTIYTEANMDFTLTPAGTTAMIKAYLKTGESTGNFIMSGLNHNLQSFYSQGRFSYLKLIKNSPVIPWIHDGKDYHVQGDEDVYSDFSNHLGQAASIIYAEARLYQQGFALGKTVVRFHYDMHTFEKDDFDVSFQSITTPARILW